MNATGILIKARIYFIIGLICFLYPISLGAQNFNGGQGDGYSSSMVNFDFTSIPDAFECQINQASGQSDPISTFPISFDVVFTANVIDFTFDDITWNGTATGISGNISGSGSVYTINVTSVSADGTIIPALAEAVVHDAGVLANRASTSTDNSVTFDSSRPGIEIAIEPGQDNPTNNSVISFRANFTEEVTGFVPGDVSLTGTAGATTINLRGGPLTYTIDVSGMTNAGTVTVNIEQGLFTDDAGNLNTQSVNTGNTIYYDNTKPDVTISSSEISPTNLTEIPVTIEFSKEVTGFTVDDINISNATIISFIEQTVGLIWIATVQPQSEGNINIIIPANVATDLSGNSNNVSNLFQIEYSEENNSNSAPIVENQSFTIEEGSTLGTIVGLINASDPDGDDLTYTIISGNIDGAFNLDLGSGQLTVANSNALDYFYNPVFNLVVQVMDSYSPANTAEANIEINLTEIDNFIASNIFTPNSSQNRYWTIRKVERYADYDLTIRNASGLIVYQTRNYQNNWDGKYKNKALPTGTYYFYLINSEKNRVYKGFINIIYE